MFHTNLNKKTISIFILSIMIFQIFSYTVSASKHDESLDFAMVTHVELFGCDLELIRFESWWSEMNNGTLFVRYLVDNKGDSYHSPIHPILLQISLFLEEDSNPFAFVNQTSFIDPYIWHKGETLGGCIQIDLSEKPEMLTAIVNQQQLIPERDDTNNKNSTIVHYGIHISGNIKKITNGMVNVPSNISIIHCDPLSLQSDLYIRFDTINGSYTVCLYPQEPFDIPHTYDLLFTDTNTSRTIHMTTQPVQYNKRTTLNVTFLEQHVNQPFKPIGPLIGFQNRSYIYITKIKGLHPYEVSYKFRWESNSYSDWFKDYPSYQIAISKHQWQKRGLHHVKVIVKDQQGQLSDWSQPTYIFII
jgi:hypothetical protein